MLQKTESQHMRSDNNYIELVITKQIEEVDLQLRELEAEKRALQRLLLKTRQNNIQNRQVTRKNSINRILVENTILETIRRSESAVNNNQLYNATLIVLNNLNKSTFRTYIKRMKDAGLIVSKGRSWTIAPSVDEVED